MSETKNHIAKGSGAGQPGLEATLSVNRNAFLGFLGHVDKWRIQRRIDVMSMKPRKLSAVLS